MLIGGHCAPESRLSNGNRLVNGAQDPALAWLTLHKQIEVYAQKIVNIHITTDVRIGEKNHDFKDCEDIIYFDYEIK